MTGITEPLEPGVHPDIPERRYHADKALSASNAKLLVPPSTPAHFKHRQENPQPPKKAFDMGHAAHTKLLGAGVGYVTIPDKLLSDDGGIRTTEAKRFCAEVRLDGKTPLKSHEIVQIDEMAAELARHPIAGKLFHPERGAAEQTLVWDDAEHGIRRRARLDWLPNAQPSGRLIIPDYKTSTTANPHEWAKEAAKYGAHIQAGNYLAGVKACGLAKDAAFVFVVQENTPPYPVSVVELELEDLTRGEVLMDIACRRFAECTATDTWPGYGDGITQISLPGWYRKMLEMELPDVF